MAEHLLTPFHISDFHIGEITWPSGDNPLTDEGIDWWKRFYPFDGYLGYTHIALHQQLGHLVRDVTERDGEHKVRVEVTGDLTTTGSATNFGQRVGLLDERSKGAMMVEGQDQ